MGLKVFQTVEVAAIGIDHRGNSAGIGECVKQHIIEARRQRDAKVAARIGRCLTERLTGVIQFLKDVGAAAVEILALFGQIHAGCGADKEGAFELLLQRANDVAQALLGYVKPLGGVGQIHVFADLAEVMQLFYIHGITPSM